MQLRQLLNDDDAVSPVIGVILMVAITVILAAVIAAFVLGLGGNNAVAPNPTFDYDYESSSGDLEISVTGGDSFDSDRVSFSGDVDEDGDTWTDEIGGTASTISAGDSVTLSVNAGDSFEMSIIWESEDGETSSEIGSTSGPDA